MSDLFGTDGIRGIAGKFPLDTRSVVVIGKALADYVAARLGRPAKIVTGRDTRESGPSIEAAIGFGVADGGGQCVSAGVITTPGVAYLAGKCGYDLGVVISASHNPFRDNGIKVFLPNGMKSDDEMERFVETAVNNSSGDDRRQIDPQPLPENESLNREYFRHLVELFGDSDFTGLRLVIDCANGAASEIAPEFFRSLGANVTAINAEPNGRNINLNCGSLHTESLRCKVIETRADVGVGFDGDADRTILVDQTGGIIDGDRILRILAGDMIARGELASRTVVATVMSNLGLEISLRKLGVKMLRTPVGDKFVLDALLRTGSELGGEQSGHIIFPRLSRVGDGIVTAAAVLRVARSKEIAFSDLAGDFRPFPQILLNIEVREKLPFDRVPEISAAVQEVEDVLSGKGRVLLRYSGTENLARVMIEAEEGELAEQNARWLADVIKKNLGKEIDQ